MITIEIPAHARLLVYEQSRCTVTTHGSCSIYVTAQTGWMHVIPKLGNYFAGD